MLQIYYEFNFEKKNNISIWIFNLFYTLWFCFQIRLPRATGLASVPQIWQPCHRYGCCDTGGGSHDTGLASVPQIWSPWHRFGFSATDLAVVPQVWLPCHRFGNLDTDLADVSVNLCLIKYAKFFKLKT